MAQLTKQVTAVLAYRHRYLVRRFQGLAAAAAELKVALPEQHQQEAAPEEETIRTGLLEAQTLVVVAVALVALTQLPAAQVVLV